MVSILNQRPVCFCENDKCPAGYPIAFAPLDVRFPPAFCKFCSAKFNFDESDCVIPQITGMGKGSEKGYGKGKGYGNGKGTGKGNGKFRTMTRSASPRRYRAQAQDDNL